jgi:hypothetical protein
MALSGWRHSSAVHGNGVIGHSVWIPWLPYAIPQVLNGSFNRVNTWGIKLSITSEQVRAARALLRWEQRHLAEASGVSLPSVKRLETRPGELAAQERTILQLRKALEKAGVEFIAANGGGAGVRLKTRVAPRSKKT